jgi:hypothetical protein
MGEDITTVGDEFSLFIGDVIGFAQLLGIVVGCFRQFSSPNGLL